MVKQPRVRRSKSILPTPHDLYVKGILQHPELALHFFKFALSKIRFPNLTSNCLSRATDSFIDAQLKQHYSDICYFYQNPKEGLPTFVFLVEHKSQNPVLGHLREQLNRYITNSWRSSLQTQTAFKLIIPIVLYHGNTKLSTNEPTALFPGLPTHFLKFIPQFDYIEIDLYVMSEMELGELTPPFLRLFFKTLKYGRHHQICDYLWDDFINFAATSKQNKKKAHFIQLTVQYLINISEPFKNKLQEMRKTTAPQHPEKVFKDFLTAYFKEELQQERQYGIEQGIEKGIEKGIKQGIEQGIEKGVHQTVQKMLISFSKKNPNLPIEVIAETFELDVVLVKKILKNFHIEGNDGTTKE